MKPPEGLAGLAAREAGHLEEPPPADARLLALANRALMARVAELEESVASLQAAIRVSEGDADALDAEAATLRELAMAASADTEARIVAWLRWKRLQTQDYTGDDNAVSWTLHVTADRIERGEHRRDK